MLETATAAIAVYSDSDVTDTFIEDSSLVMGWMHLMASDLGLGSCWLQLRLRPSNEEGVSAEEFVNRRLGAPDNQNVEALLVMGHIDEARLHTSCRSCLVTRCTPRDGNFSTGVLPAIEFIKPKNRPPNCAYGRRFFLFTL